MKVALVTIGLILAGSVDHLFIEAIGVGLMALGVEV